MTDLRHRLDSILGNEPAPPDDLDHIVTAGRRSLRRRTALTGAAGTAGVAALTAAVVVPIVAVTQHNAPSSIGAGAHPSSMPGPHCKVMLIRHGTHASVQERQRAKLKLAELQEQGRLKSFKIAHGHVIAVRTCSSATPVTNVSTPTPTPTGSPTPTPTPTGPSAPRYHYAESPTKISHRLADALYNRLDAWGLNIVYQRPFAQETSTLEKGHPSYFDGNDDVKVDGDLADVGVQVAHAVTKQVPFDSSCKAPRCVQTTLADGSVEQVSSVHAGTGGGTIVVVEVRHPNGLIVEAQQSNYGFGPDATRARGSQPLTMAQLKSLASDPAFAF